MVGNTSEAVTASTPRSAILGSLCDPTTSEPPESLISFMCQTPHHSSVILSLCQKGRIPQTFPAMETTVWTPCEVSVWKIRWSMTCNFHSVIHHPGTAGNSRSLLQRRNTSPWLFQLLLQTHVIS